MDSLNIEVVRLVKDSLNVVVSDTTNIANGIQNLASEEKASWVSILLENNPGFANLLLTSFLLPLAILIYTNWNNNKAKRLEKQLNLSFNTKEDLRRQEKMIFGSLSKILFDIQQLYVSLSGTCVDSDCITEAISAFNESLKKNHSEISDNLLFLSSELIDNIYLFYNKMSDLKIEIEELNVKKEYKMAHVCVYKYSEELANIVISLQEKLVQKRKDIAIEFDKTKQENMRYCCGQAPPKHLIEKYNKLKLQVETYKLNEEHNYN